MTKNTKVEIYSTPTCGYCKKAKAFLSKNDIAYTEYDVSNSKAKRREMVEKSGQMGVPVIIIGDKIMIGFDEKKLRKELDL